VILEATRETRATTLYATLVVILAVVPVFFMGGVSGAFFEPLATAFILAVLASMVVALTVTPVLGLVLLSGAPGRESPLAAWLQRKYESLLARIMAPQRALFGTAALATLAAIAVAPFLGHSLLPALKERQLLVNWTTAPGTSYTETYRITTRALRELHAIPGVRNAGAHVGRAITGDQVVGINSSQIWLSIDPQADYDATVAAIRETIEGYPGSQRSLHGYLREKVSEVLTGSGNAIVVRLYGPKREVLQDKAEEVRKALAGIRGIADLRVDGQVEEPQVEVLVNLDAAGKAGVKPGDVRRASATVFSGLTVGFLFEQQKIYDVVVWGAPETRHSISNLENLWVGRSDRQNVRLGDVAEVRIVPTPAVLKHEAIAPYVDVVANVAGRDLGSVADEVEDVLDKMQFPLEHNPKLLGEHVERQAVEERILSVTIAAVIGIFLLLQACFASWRLAGVGMLALPAALAGGLLAVLASGATVSLGSLVGFIAVLGIAVRNGMLLIDHYRTLERSGMPLGPELVIRGARERVVPTVASAAAIFAALLPIAVLGRVAGLELLHPMTLVIFGGLAASTAVTLLVMPALYLVAGGSAKGEPAAASL